MSSVLVSIFTAGFCSCPEHIAIQGGRWRNIHFPAMFVANILFPDPAAYRATLTDLQNYQKNQPGVRLIPSHCEATLAQYRHR